MRVGTEWRAGDMYYRAGWGFVPDAYKSTDPLHAGAQKTYSAGIGYRSEHLTIDLGLNYVLQSTRFFPYSPDLVQAVNEERASYRTFLTFALRP